MNKDIKFYIALGGFFFMLVLAIMWAGNEYNASNPKETLFYHAMSSFQETNGPWVRHPNLVFHSGSAENVFLQGMDRWAAGDYQGAKALFDKCLTLNRIDLALPIYAYYYINDCIYQQQGIGDKTAINNALLFISQYPPAANNTDLLWSMINTLIPNTEDFQQGINVLSGYLNIARNLELHTSVWILNTIAMLEYNSGDYAKSIRKFYDVEMMLENQPMTPEIQDELLFAREYIANTQLFLEDYQSAADLYQQLVDSVPPEGPFNHYNCYLNLASCYLELEQIAKARETNDELYQYLPRIELEDKQEIIIAIQDMWTNISLAEGNVDQARLHLQEMERYYQEHTNNVFLNGQQLYLITKGKYLITQRQYEAAQVILEDLSSQSLSYNLKKEVLELLVKIYQQTNEADKLLQAYSQSLDLNNSFIQTIQRAYLEFSQYYRENSKLKKYNAQLKQTNVIVVLGIVIVSCSLIIISVLLKFLSTKNLTDQLTGVYNRKKLNQLARIYRRKGTPELFSVIMLDIDYFKLYNDTYGHVAGDMTLKQVAQMLSASVRHNDYVIRYGGEEFLVLLNKVNYQVAQSICQRIHRQLDILAIPHSASKVSDHVTVSVGMCHQQNAAADSLDKLIQQADQCLYQSKEAGRNRTTSYEGTA